MVPGPPSSRESGFKNRVPRGGNRGVSASEPVPAELLIPGFNHFCCFLAGEEAGVGEEDSFLDRQDQEVKQE